MNKEQKAGTEADSSTTVQDTFVRQPCTKPNVSGSFHSLHKDLKGFQETRFLTPDEKIGLGIAIEQVERYMRGDLEARQQ